MRTADYRLAAATLREFNGEMRTARWHALYRSPRISAWRYLIGFIKPLKAGPDQWMNRKY